MELKDLLFGLIIIYASAKVMGELAVRVGQSAVLGELLAGVLVGGSVLGLVHETETLKLLGEIGVMLLLFEVGLESDLQSFLRVGRSAAAVAAIGVIVPFGLGYPLALALNLNHMQAVFISATLTATSVAISARVLSDLNRLKTAEGNIILGAAVIDDILGLVILAVVLGLAASGTVSWLQAGRTAGLAVLFLTGAIVLGIKYAHLFSRLVNLMRTRGALISAAMIFILLLGYLSEELQMAPLIGAFAAGLILARTEHHARIVDFMKPVADVVVPVFFVMIGAAVDLSHLNPFNPQNVTVLWLAAGLTMAAIIGKLASGLGAIGEKANRWAIGVGMIPRGEVGIIFASVGLSSAIIDQAQYSAILVMVALTTLMAPILLKLLFKQSSSRVPQ